MFKGVKWEEVPFEEASETWSVLEASNESIAIDELGEMPEHFRVMRGDVKLKGDHKFGESFKGYPQTEVTVIEGALTCDGTLTFDGSDNYNMLIVTGAVTTKNLILAMEGHLFVGQSLTVKETLFTSLGDAGHLVVKGATKAKTWIDSSGRGCIEQEGEIDARRVRDENARDDAPEGVEIAQNVLLPAFTKDGSLVDDKVIAAIKKGTKLFR